MSELAGKFTSDQREPPEGVRRRDVQEWQDGALTASRAGVPVEQPVDIRVDSTLLVTLFCLPEHLEELACGFLLGQGFIGAMADVASVSASDAGAVDLVLRQPLAPGTLPARRTVIYSGCGQGPIAMPEPVTPGAAGAPKGAGQQEAGAAPGPARQFPAADLRRALSETLRRGAVYRETRAVHSAAVCTRRGGIMALREDVGRHNALDKCLGWAAARCLDPQRIFIAASGRISSEAIDKLARFGISVMVAKGVPTSLALDRADSLGITLAGSLGPHRLRIYSHPERVTR